MPILVKGRLEPRKNIGGTSRNAGFAERLNHVQKHYWACFLVRMCREVFKRKTLQILSQSRDSHWSTCGVIHSGPGHRAPTYQLTEVLFKQLQVFYKCYRRPSDRKAPSITNAERRSRSSPSQSPRLLSGISSCPMAYISSLIMSSDFWTGSSRAYIESSHWVSLIVTATVFASGMLGKIEVKRLESNSEVPSTLEERRRGKGRYSAWIYQYTLSEWPYAAA